VTPIAGEEVTPNDLIAAEYMLFRDSERPGEPRLESGRSEVSLEKAIEKNVIRLRTDDVEEQLAVSFAFAQSAKLSVLEGGLDQLINEIRTIPEQLSKTGRSEFSAKQIAKLSGRVFLERNEANLYSSSILGSPVFFWEAEGFEPLYRQAYTYLDTEERLRILNKRLDIVNDLLDSLSDQLEIRNSHRLEWIIIVLIMLEIALELPHKLNPFVTVPLRLVRRIVCFPFA